MHQSAKFVKAFGTCIVMIMLLLSCRQQKNTVTQKIDSLYGIVASNTALTADSLLYFSGQLKTYATGHAPEYRSMGYIAEGMYHNSKADYAGAMQSYKEAGALLINSKADSLKARVIAGLAAGLKNTGRFPEAIAQYQQALTLYEGINDKPSMAAVHTSMAQGYQLREDLGTAQIHLQTALELLEDRRYTPTFLVILHTLANVYGMQNKLDSALALDETGIAIANRLNLPLLKSTFLDNKANCFMYSNRPDSARIYFKASLLIDSVAGNKKQVADTYLNLGTLEAMQKNYPLAESRFRRAILLSQETGYRHGKATTLNALTDLYRESGRIEKAFVAQSAYIKLRDSLINEKTETTLAELRTVYETGKKEQEIAVQRERIFRQNIIITGIVLVSLLLLTTGYFWYRRKQLNKQRDFEATLYEQQQEAAVSILTAEEKERQRIAYDLHDGIGQTITAAWFNLQALSNKEVERTEEEKNLIARTVNLIGESSKEIRQVSHNMMPISLQKKGLVKALQEFTGQMDEGIIKVRFQADESLPPLDQTKEIMLYRIIQECLNNTVKHAGATEIDISITHDDIGYDVLVEDNGSGFDTHNIQSAGAGLQNIRSRVQYLQGTVEWNSTKSGTVVAIHIPTAINSRHFQD